MNRGVIFLDKLWWMKDPKTAIYTFIQIYKNLYT